MLALRKVPRNKAIAVPSYEKRIPRHTMLSVAQYEAGVAPYQMQLLL